MSDSELHSSVSCSCNNYSSDYGGIFWLIACYALLPLLGPVSRQDLCATCNLTERQCPGHMGHIELNMPVYHPLWMRNLFLVNRTTLITYFWHSFFCCLYCTLLLPLVCWLTGRHYNYCPNRSNENKTVSNY